MKKRVLLAFMVIMLSIIAFGAISASADTYGNFTYEIYSDEVCITSFESIDATGTISIPSSIKGYPVTQIDSYAFKSCSKITGVSIPSTVWYMGTGVFTWCESLKSVTIPAGVERFLDADTFSGCSSLTDINVSSSNPNYSSVNGVLYSKDKTTLLAYPQGKTATSFSVPSTVTSISSGAFSGCSQLKSISLPNGLQNISSDVFSGCSGLTEIKIPSSVTNIATDAFDGCSGISKFEVDNANSAYMSIDGVLYTKDKKSLLNYPLGKTDTIFHVPTGVNIISSSAFAYEDNLMEISLPDGLTEIGTEAFYNCDALKTINIPVSIKKISTNAFKYASAISKAIYDGTESEWAQVTVNGGNTTLKNKIVFQKIYLSIYEDKIQTKKVKIDAGSVFPSSLIYQKEGYTVKLYSDSNYTTSFSQSSVLTKDTDIYIKYIPYNLNKFEILGVESANVGAFGIIQYTAFATDKDVNTLYSFIKYPDCLTLKSVTPKDFAYAEKEDEYTENGYTTAVILAQYSDTELIPANVIHTPFELVFDVSKTAIPGTVQIEATEDTCLIGNDTYFFEDRFAGELEITPKLAESIMITGDDVISSETTYIATVLPDYTTNKEVEWSVDNESIATVDELGIVTPVTSGTIVLTAAAKDGSGVSTTKSIVITVSVRANSITSDTGTWNKEFDSDFTEYIIYVNKDVTSVYLTSSFNDATAKVNGSLAANGIRKKVTLTGQETVVEIVLTPTAGNELQANTYTITIIRGSYTKTTVSEDRKTVTVNPVNIPNGKRVILALYDGGKLTETQIAVYAGEEITFTTTKSYTDAKVMVWDDLTNLMPVCDLEYIK